MIDQAYREGAQCFLNLGVRPFQPINPYDADARPMEHTSWKTGFTECKADPDKVAQALKLGRFREPSEADRVYNAICAAEKKLVTIEDFLINQFDLDEDQYTKHELYELLDHVTRLLDTEDGTLTDEQQAEANEVPA